MSPSKIDIGGISVYYCEISGGGTRRRAECAAVDALIAYAGLTGPVEHRNSGAPYLAAHPELHISVSHSRRLAALAVSRHPVGIDVEEWRDNLPRVLPRVLSDTELAAWSDHPLEAWTAKESLYKIAGIPGADFAADLHIDRHTNTATVRDALYALHFITIGVTTLCVCLPR